jgi:hypothetical protein
LNINCSEALSKHVSKDNQLQQIIVVTALSENNNTATLQRYERQKNHKFEK